jgi:hypothetical protein
MKVKVNLFALGICLLLSRASVYAGSATWGVTPTNGDWNTATNWQPATVPNGPADQATFGVSSILSLFTSAATEVNSIIYNAGANAFTISPNPAFPFTISGAGITNSSTALQTFIGGNIAFTNSASAGALTGFTAPGAIGGGGAAGSITFSGSATAGSAKLIATGGSGGGAGGLIKFSDNASGGTAAVQLSGNATLDLTAKTDSLTIGSLNGNGRVNLGTSTLIFNGFEQTSVFSGRIQGIGGINISFGFLQLTKGNTYRGGTTLAAADGAKTLTIANTTGSATGSGPVSINGGGILNGSGTISGPVTVNDSGQLMPSSGFTTPQTMIMSGGLSLTNLGRFQVLVDLERGVSDTVIANGVALSGGVGPVFVVNATPVRVPIGTVFTVINNTSSTPITGTFFQLPEGSFINLGNNRQLNVSYVGGDGNDFTLTLAARH